MMSKGFVAFRTHLWGPYIQLSARRAYAQSIGSDFAVLLDETAQSYQVHPFAKISHTDDFSDYGLKNLPAKRLLWFSADYALYALRRAAPHYEIYVLYEHDVACTADLTELIAKVTAERIDLVAHEIIPSTPDWMWHKGGLTISPHPIKAFFPFMVISGRAIDYLYQARLELFRRLEHEPAIQLPISETFIPTMLATMPDYRCAELSRFVNLPYFTFEGPFHPADPICDTLDAIIHPVLADKPLVNNIIRDYGLTAIAKQDPRVVRRLQFTPRSLIIEVLATNLTNIDLLKNILNDNPDVSKLLEHPQLLAEKLAQEIASNLGRP